MLYGIPNVYTQRFFYSQNLEKHRCTETKTQKGLRHVTKKKTTFFKKG